MSDPILEDGAFRSTLDAVLQKIQSKLVELVAGEEPPRYHTPAPGERPPPVGTPPPNPDHGEWAEKADECNAIMNDCLQFVEQLAAASTAAADAELDSLQQAVDIMSWQASIDKGNPVKTIRGLSATWAGSPAAVNFQNYVNALETSVQNEFEYVASMHGLMNVHRELIYASREGVLDVCDRTLGQLGEVAEQRRKEEESRRRQAWADFVTSAFAVAAGAVTGGPAGALTAAVTEAIGGIGKAISGRITDDVDRADPRDIVRAMRDSIIKLRRDIRHEENKLKDGIDTLLRYAKPEKQAEIVAPLIPG